MHGAIGRACALLLAFWTCAGVARAAVFTGIEYGRDDARALLLDVRTPAKPGPFAVWVEWVDRDASPLIVPDREVHAAQTILVRAAMPARVEARAAAAAQLMAWLSTSISGYGGDPARVAMIVRGAGAQALLDLWKPDTTNVATQHQPSPGVVALVLVEPPASLRGHRDWPDLPLLLIDDPSHASRLWKVALGLRNLGIAAEPVVQEGLASASPGLSTHVAGMLAASAVPRVQRFDQLAFDAPVELAGVALDAIRYGSGLVALTFDAGAATVRLVSIDDSGAVLELRHWPWREDARLAAMDGRLLVLGSDAEGHARAEFGPGTDGEWTSLDTSPVRSPVRLAALSVRGRGEIAVAWSGAAARGAPQAWLQWWMPGGSMPRVSTSRRLARSVHAVAFAGSELLAASGALRSAGSPGRDERASLLRWHPGKGTLAAIPDPDPAPWQALASLSPDAAVEAQATFLGLRGGRLFFVDLSCAPACVREELDFAGLLAAPFSPEGLPAGDRRRNLSRDGGPAVATQWLRHPGTGESLLAVMPGAVANSRVEASAGAWLLRQSSGRYGFARLPRIAGGSARLALRAVQPWPADNDPNRFALFARNGDDSVIFPARLQRTGMVPGLWWDPARSGHGFDLRRAGDAWQVTVYTFDERGAPIWLRGNGDIHDRRWRARSDGLLRYRIAGGRGAVEIDRRSAQSLELEFAPADAAGPCGPGARASASNRAQATLALGEARSTFCLEPLRLAASGRPRIDVDGIWNTREEPAPWQLSLTTQGDDPRARISALLTYFDRSGAPRWAYAASDWRGGVAELPLLAVRGACKGCADQPFESAAIGLLSLRATGECGAIVATAGLRVLRGGGAIGMPAARVGLEPAALLGCY